MARYRIVALPTMSKGGIFNRKKNQQPPQVTHTPIDPAYLQEHPDVASSVLNMPEVGVSYKKKRDFWGRPEGSKWYQFNPKSKQWEDDYGRNYTPKWKQDERKRVKEENTSWTEKIGDFINQDIFGHPTDEEQWQKQAEAEASAKRRAKQTELMDQKMNQLGISLSQLNNSPYTQEYKDASNHGCGEGYYYDPVKGCIPSIQNLYNDMAREEVVRYNINKEQRGKHGSWDNYGDGGIDMVYPEAYVMGPSGGLVGMGKQGVTGLMEAVAATNKFALNDLLSAGVRSTLSPLEKTIAEKATVGNILGAYSAGDALVNKAPKLVGDISSMASEGYSGDKTLDALKQTADITSSFMPYTRLANAKHLNKVKDVYSLSKATASNLEDPTNIKDQYSFYRNLGKLSGIKKKGGSVELELSDEEIQDYINKGYVVEEAFPKMNNGGPIVRDLWKQVTGTPWEEAKARGLTTGTFDENIALRNRLLAGEFGKVNLKPTKSDYDLAVEQLVKSGKTLDELVEMRVGTESGLKNRFPELFNEETKDKVKTQLKKEINKNQGIQTKINTNPYSDFGKVKTKPNKYAITGLGIEPLKYNPYKPITFDLGEGWRNKMYQDFGKPKKENKIKKEEKKEEKINDQKIKQRLNTDFNVKATKADFERMKKDPTIKNILDMLSDNRKKYEPKKNQSYSGSTMPLGPMAKDYSKMKFESNPKSVLLPSNYDISEWGDIKRDVAQTISNTKRWAENQLETLEKGVSRKLITFGVLDDNDKEVETEPITADKYYSNPYGAQQTFDVEKGNGRQFKQQSIPVSTIKFGYRNRGNYEDINTDGLEITTFEPFTNNGSQLKDWNSVLALDPNGRLHTGSYGKLKNKMDNNWVFTKTFMNRVISIDDKFLDGRRSGNAGYWQAQITTLDGNGNKKIGALNILTGGKGKEKYYGSIQGGRLLLVDPKTNEQFLVSGSLDHIKSEFKRIKGDNPYLEVYTLDNGTYSRGLSYKDKKLTKERLRSYDNENTSGGNGLYIVSYDVPVNRYQQSVIKGMPNVRTKADASYKKGHKLKNEAQMIVLHHTGNIDPSIAKKEIRNQYMKKGNNSSHVVIYQDGSREIYASPEQVTFHAGESRWGSREDLNDFSIGVEFDGDTNYAPLTDAQIESFVEYYDPLAKKYNIKLSDIITHQMIRDRYLKEHKNKATKVKTKPDITQTEYKRILKYLKDKGYE